MRNGRRAANQRRAPTKLATVGARAKPPEHGFDPLRGYDPDGDELTQGSQTMRHYLAWDSPSLSDYYTVVLRTPVLL